MSEKMTCTVCGYPNDDGSEICENCGASLSNGANELEDIRTDAPNAASATEAKAASTTPAPVAKKSPSEKSKKKQRQNNAPVETVAKKKPMQSEIFVRDGMVRIQMKIWQFFGLTAIGIALIVLVILYLVNSSVPEAIPAQSAVQQLTPQGPSLSDIEAARAQVTANPDNPAVILSLSHALHDSNMFDQAVSSYRRYLEIVPDNPDARVDLGICLHALGQNEAAIAEMSTAVDKNPDHQLGHFNLGIVNLAIGDSSAAKTWLRRTIELNAANQIGQRAATLITEISSDAVQ